MVSDKGREGKRKKKCNRNEMLRNSTSEKNNEKEEEDYEEKNEGKGKEMNK